MRKTIIAGNWKMHGSISANTALVNEVITGVHDGKEGVEVIVCPPSIYLSQVTSLTDDSVIQVGAQNINCNEVGAYTGEISGEMVKDIGATHSIIGHSERRTLYHETNEIIARKISTTLDFGLTPIFCIGETLAEREAGKTHVVLKEQITTVIDALGIAAFSKLIIAYEPVWAIGTGVVATPEQAQEAHEFIRGLLSEYDSAIAESTHILYGGSMNAKNCGELLKCADIDGGLIGGASLKAEEFLTIYEQA